MLFLNNIKLIYNYFISNSKICKLSQMGHCVVFFVYIILVTSLRRHHSRNIQYFLNYQSQNNQLNVNKLIRHQQQIFSFGRNEALNKLSKH